MHGVNRVPLRTYSTPTPFGACSLCPLSESMSTAVRLRSSGSLPTDWTASVWKRMPRSRHISAMRSIGKRTPVSLFACMTVTMAVSGASAASTSARSSRPSELTEISVTR